MRRLSAPLLMMSLGCAEGATVPSGAGGGGGPGSGGEATGGAVSSAGGGRDAGGAAQGGAAQGAGGAGGQPGVDQSCPADQLAIGVDASGSLECAPIDGAVASSFNEGCDLYLGIRDNCGSCSTEPSKWGSVGGASCDVGVGANNTCAPATLGGATVELFGLNTDGDVDDNDKLYAALSCAAGVAGEGPGPCAPGELVVAYDGATATCAAASSFVLDYARSSCSLYLGWRDGCGACTDPPLKWGSAGSLACDVGAGAGNTCVTTTLGGAAVPLLGVDLDGDVDDNDKLYFGLRCDAGAELSSSDPATCPAGQVVVGVRADGALDCASPAPLISQYVAAHCTLYAGFRDACDGCTTAPAKYGRVREGWCTNDVGVNDTCVTASLDGQMVSLLGLDLDGDVNDDDKLYVGLSCD